MATKIDQKAYLQKYLSGPSRPGDKKKKKKKSFKGKGLKIVVDNLDVSKLRPLEGDELDILGEGEDAPQVAGIIDERPDEIKKLEQFKTSSKWRVINEDDGFSSKLKIEEIKKDVVEIQKENELIFGKMYSDSEDEDTKKDSDQSPPRKQSNSDQSPRRKNTLSKPKTSRKPQNNSGSDFSPPRRIEKDSVKSKTESKRTEKDQDLSPPRKQDSQLNRKPREKARKPSRWGEKEKSKSVSPRRSHKSQAPVKQTNNSDSDVSPPLKQKRNYDSDVSPPRKSQKRDKRKTSPDESTQKNQDRQIKNYSKAIAGNSSRHKSSDSDLSPPRKKSSSANKQQNLPSPSRRSKKQSPSRSNRKQDSDSDLSPPRKQAARTDDRYKKSNESPPPSNEKMAARTLDGKMAGLSDARQLRHENEAFRRREEEAFKNMTDDISGRNAQVVSRKSKREDSEERRKLEDKTKKQQELNEKYKRWGKGLKQLEEQESRVQEYLHESAKPLARHRDDRDLEASLKDIERDGDPMLQYIRERKRERGELPPEKPRYKGNFPPNRFNIRPGYRWDGVDRSNGYEKKFFDQQSRRRALEEEAYKWSTEDL